MSGKLKNIQEKVFRKEKWQKIHQKIKKKKKIEIWMLIAEKIASFDKGSWKSYQILLYARLVGEVL